VFNIISSTIRCCYNWYDVVSFPFYNTCGLLRIIFGLGFGVAVSFGVVSFERLLSTDGDDLPSEGDGEFATGFF
jgi:hypothetical protein